MRSQKVTRRHLLGAIPGALALVGGISCGGDDDDDSAPAATSTSSGGAASPTAPTELRLVPLSPSELGAPAVPAGAVSTSAAAVPHAAAVAAYDTFGTDAAPGVFPRTIRHATGSTEIKQKPVRVLPMDSGELDTVVQLGLKPIGYLDYDAALLPPYLVDVLKGLKTIGTLAEPNLETVASLNPDILLTTKVRHEKIQDRIKAIAPSIWGISTGVVWKQNFALYSKSLGMEVEADKIVRAYEERVRALNAKLPSPRPTVSVVRVLGNNIRYYQRANYSGTLLTDLGFPRPASQNVDDFALLNQSLETVGQSADADIIVVSPTEGTSGAFFRQVTESPLWKNLSAVKKGAVLVVSDDVWMAGIGYRAAGTIMDDIARHFKV
jgi:iron complex transport system substrate-binding protein